MEVGIKIKIRNQGNLRGTVGWLAQNAATIDIGKTNGDNQGAWLLDHAGKTITTLAVRNFWDDGEIAKLGRDARNCVWFGEAPDPTDDIMACSDSCWNSLETIINKAVELMDEAWEDGEQPSFKLEDKSG